MQQDAIQREMQKTEILQLGPNMIRIQNCTGTEIRDGMKYANNT